MDDDDNGVDWSDPDLEGFMADVLGDVNTDALDDDEAIELGIVEGIADLVDDGDGLPDINADAARMRDPLALLPIHKRGKYNPDMDLLNANVLAREMTETIPRTRMLSSPSICLAVASGFISNVRVHESELVQRAVPDVDTPVYNSNYGRKVYEHYMYPAPPPKTNRGRKPKKNAARQRKKQGDGNDMASQASIYVRSRVSEPVAGYIIEPDALMYKMKVFCTGDVQVPNAAQVDMQDMLECTKVLVDALNRMLHGGRPVSQLLYMHPTLKNYKLSISVPADHVIDLSHLEALLICVRDFGDPDAIARARPYLLARPLHESPARPQILHVVYTRKDSNLAIIFATPTLQIPSKKLRFNVYIDGSVTILGGLYMDTMRDIYAFMDWLLETNYETLIVRTACYPTPRNVRALTHDECVRMHYEERAEWMRAICKKHGCGPAATELLLDLFGCRPDKYLIGM